MPPFLAACLFPFSPFSAFNIPLVHYIFFPRHFFLRDVHTMSDGSGGGSSGSGGSAVDAALESRAVFVPVAADLTAPWDADGVRAALAAPATRYMIDSFRAACRAVAEARGAMRRGAAERSRGLLSHPAFERLRQDVRDADAEWAYATRAMCDAVPQLGFCGGAKAHMRLWKKVSYRHRGMPSEGPERDDFMRKILFAYLESVSHAVEARLRQAGDATDLSVRDDAETKKF